MYEGNPVDLRMEKSYRQMEFLMKRRGSAG